MHPKRTVMYIFVIFFGLSAALKIDIPFHASYMHKPVTVVYLNNINPPLPQFKFQLEYTNQVIP